MNVLMIFYPLAAVMMLVLAVGPGVWLTQRFHLSWRLWGLGAITFLLSQIGHIPFNLAIDRFLTVWTPDVWMPNGALLFNALFLGLSAALWEEGLRYAMFRWWAKEARNWRTALLTGAGHGGMEAIILGGLALLTFFRMMALRGADLSTLVAPQYLSMAQNRVTAYWSVAWWMPWVGWLERVFALCIQLSLAALMVQVFRRGEKRWFWLAFGYHALADALTVFLFAKMGLSVEGIIALLALFSLWIIFRLRDTDRPSAAAAAAQDAASLPLGPVTLDEEDLDAARYES